MAAKEKELAVFAHVNGQFVPSGLLVLTEDSAETISSRFAYGARYLERPNNLEIDPSSLPLSKKPEWRVPANNLTLFGGIRDAAPDGWGRRVIAARLKTTLDGLPESTFLLEAGDDRAGALDVRPSIESPPHAHRKISIHRLEYLLDAAERIEQGASIPTALEDIFDAGSAFGGARPKATVEDDDGTLLLAKFPSEKDPFNVPVIETATLRLAKKAGLDFYPVRTELIHNKTVMLMSRFDRAIVGEKPQRIHMISALTAIGCHESESINASYWDIADQIKRLVHPSKIKDTQKELFGRMVFNILVSNDDDHLRNHAFLWDPILRKWNLSPLYDVVPHSSHAYDRNLHLSVGTKGRSATLDNALSGYSRFGLTLLDAKEIIDRVWRITREWKNYFEDFGVPGSEIEKVSGAFRHIDEVLTSKLR